MGRQLTWYPPAHTGLPPVVLNNPTAGYRVHKGSRGLGATPRELITEDSPWLDGTSVEDDFALPRSIMLPMGINAVTRTDMLGQLREFGAAMRTRAPGGKPAPGELELAQDDGRRFRVTCYYMRGLPDEETVDTGGDTNWVRFQLQLLAPDPYWHKAEPTMMRWQFGDPVPFLGDPFLPLRISASSAASTTILNGGSEDAYGTWKVVGPGTDLTMLNQDTGEKTRIVETIPAGQTLTIVTEPSQVDIALQPSGTDWWGELVDGSTLWSIPAGKTNVALTLAGATSASSIELTFYERHGAPW